VRERVRALAPWIAIGLGWLPAACGAGQVPLCGEAVCTANAACVERDDGDVCECRDGYVMRAGRCQPEGPCGRLAKATCEAVGGQADACGALRRAVALADGDACARRVAEGVLDSDIQWLGEVQPMLARCDAPEYAAILTRSLVDPCGAAVDLLCTVMRPNDPACGAAAGSVPGDDRGCRTLVRNYDQSLVGASAAGEGSGAEPGESSDTVETPGVLVRLVPDPASAGTMPARTFRAALVVERDEIESCYAGAVESFPGLAGRAIYQVHVAADGAVTVALGRADGPISGSGVADCVREALGRMDLAATPPAGGDLSVHAAFEFGYR